MKYWITRTSCDKPKKEHIQPYDGAYQEGNKWMIDIDDIHRFVDEVGEEVILSVYDFPDGKMYSIEIYDDYRE